MPTHLAFDDHLAGLHDAMTAFARHAERAGIDTDVPTCPEWTVRRLIGHQGAVHRWAAGGFTGVEVDWDPVEKAGRSSADPVEWLRDGAIELVTTLVKAPADGATPRAFLHDAPPPRAFWARRQCHETTIHAVDALAAALGRRPRAEETWIGPDLALDGVDELLLGFVPRSRSKLRSETPLTLAVRLTDADRGYLIEVSNEPPRVTRHDGADVDLTGDRTIEGTAAQLYLALWQRSDELDSDFWPLWERSAVR
ncbi:maleylpyruvate isomerase family mycothiol-dependent enzyme [Nocardioides sp. GXZ039]|uniref:maleylpyruvate isomerase family mycothiol-dependent enzyme n=1 Tax=Nocardioides sp. GXZ039 TaxID=3136018 RepID=UPI0030F3BD55